MKKILLFTAVAVSTLCTIGFLIGVGVLIYISDELPDFRTLADYRPNLVTTIYATDGTVIGELYKERRYLVPLRDIPKDVSNTFLAAEDKAFYEHDGVNLFSIVRAFIINMWHGSVRQGGSTITQQVVKALLLSPEKTYDRKLKEAILAYRIEKYLSKEEILTIYLNQIYFGEGAYGIEAAARTYFGKHVRALTVAEASIIASLPKAPSRYNPYINPELAKQRQLYVLGQMLDMHWLTNEEYQQAVNQPLIYKKMGNENTVIVEASKWYVEEVRKELLNFFAKNNLQKNNILIDTFGSNAVYTLGLNVYTPLSIKEQVHATSALRKGLIAVSQRRGWQGALQHIETKGETLLFVADSKKHFNLTAFLEGAWAEALVTAVTPTTATVSVGGYQGIISLQDMAWARTPDIEHTLAGYTKIKNVGDALSVGDVVFVSYKKTKENEPIDVTQTTKLPLLLQQIPDMDGAIVSMNVHTGDIVAIAGGYDFTRSEFNRAIQARRQPGSAFKPIVYSTALDEGYTAASVVLDAPVAIVDSATNQLWRPNNYENKFYGYMLLRKAIAFSRNLCTIRIAQHIGISKIIDRAKTLGLTGKYPLELGISLGSVETSLLQLTDAFAVFANGGNKVVPRFITSIKDSAGYILHEFPVESVEVLSPQNAYITQYLLQGVIQEGNAGRARVLNIPVGGKTGTSNDEKDAWFIGVTPYLATGVFVGYDKVQSLGKYEGGAKTALPIFVNYMSGIKSLYPAKDFPVPEGIVRVQVDAKTGLLPNSNTRATLFIPFIRGTEPVESATTAPATDAGTDLLKELF